MGIIQEVYGDKAEAVKTARLFNADEATFDNRMGMFLNGVTAHDPITGAYLIQSKGRSLGLPKWYLFFGDAYVQPVVGFNPDTRPYREWRTVFRASCKAEAIEIANKKLRRLIEKGRAHVSAYMSVSYK